MSSRDRAWGWTGIGVILLVVGLGAGPGLFLDPPEDPEADDGGLARTLDVLPWVLLVLAVYLAVAVAIELVLRRRHIEPSAPR